MAGKWWGVDWKRRSPQVWTQTDKEECKSWQGRSESNDMRLVLPNRLNICVPGRLSNEKSIETLWPLLFRKPIDIYIARYAITEVAKVEKGIATARLLQNKRNE